jgi:hypothetical protein
MRIRFSGFASASQPSAEPVLCPQVSSLTTWLASCPTPCHYPAAPSCCPSISRTRTPTSGSRNTSAKTTVSPSGSKGIPFWIIPDSATAAHLSCCRTCGHCFQKTRSRESCFSASSSSGCPRPCPTPSWTGKRRERLLRPYRRWAAL